MRKAPSYKDLPEDVTTIAVKEALVVAAAQLSALDSLSGPKCLIRLGQLPIICHILAQLQHAGIERVVVLCGYKGDKVKEVVERDLPEECKSSLKIEYVMAGEEWHRGCAYSINLAKACFDKSKHFLMCMADHIFDPKLIAKTVAKKPKPGEAFALVEKDFKGMVGMPQTSVKCSCRTFA
jgi:glucose-1-phosphate thymidylyltransferase